MFKRRVLALALATSMILGNTQVAMAAESTAPVSIDGGTITTNADGSLQITSDGQNSQGGNVSDTQGSATPQSSQEEETADTQQNTSKPQTGGENGGSTDNNGQTGTSEGNPTGAGGQTETNGSMGTDNQTGANSGNTETGTTSPNTGGDGEDGSTEDSTGVLEENTDETLEEESDESTSEEETEDLDIDGTTVSENGLSVSMNEILAVERNYLETTGEGAVVVEITNQADDFSPDKTTMNFETLAAAKEYIVGAGVDKAHYKITFEEKSSGAEEENKHTAGSEDLNYPKTTVEGKGVELDLNGNPLYLSGNATISLTKISDGSDKEAGINLDDGASATFVPQGNDELEISVPIQGTNTSLTFGDEDSTADSQINFSGELPDSLSSLTVCGTFIYCGTEINAPIKTGNLDLTNGDLYLIRTTAAQETETTYGIIVEKKATLGVGQQLIADPLTRVELADVYVALPKGESSDSQEAETFQFELHRKVESEDGNETEALADVSILGSVTWDSQVIVPIEFVKVDEWNAALGTEEETARVPFEENEVLATVNGKITNTAPFRLENDSQCIKKEGNELKAVNSVIVVENTAGVRRGYTSFEEAVANLSADFGGRADSYSFRFTEDMSLTKDVKLPDMVTSAYFGTSEAAEGKLTKQQLDLNGFNLTVSGELTLSEGLRLVSNNNTTKTSTLFVGKALHIDETAALTEETTEQASAVDSGADNDTNKTSRPAVLQNVNISAKTGAVNLYVRNVKSGMETSTGGDSTAAVDGTGVRTINGNIEAKSLNVNGGNWKINQIIAENLFVAGVENDSYVKAGQTDGGETVAFLKNQAQLMANQVTVNNGRADIYGILGTEAIQNGNSDSSDTPVLPTDIILNKAKLYVGGANAGDEQVTGTVYLTSLTVKAGAAYLGESMSDWTVENRGFLYVDSISMQAGTFQNKGGIVLALNAQVNHFINDEGGSLIADRFIQSAGSKAYLGEESKLVVNESGVFYNVNLGNEKGNGGNAYLGKHPDATLELRGTFTVNQEGQQLNFMFTESYYNKSTDEGTKENKIRTLKNGNREISTEDSNLVEAALDQLLFSVEANKAFPVEYINVLPKQIDKDSQKVDNPLCAAYQSGKEIKVTGEYITLYTLINNVEGEKDQEQELRSFSGWKDMVTYLTTTGNVNTTYIVQLNSTEVDVGGVLTLPKNVEKLVIRGKEGAQGERTTLKYVGDVILTTNTEFENINFSARRAAASVDVYSGILKTNGKNLKLTNVNGSFSSITGTATTVFTMIDSKITVTGKVSGLGEVTLIDNGEYYELDTKSKEQNTGAQNPVLCQTTLQVNGGLTVNTLNLTGGILEVPGAKNSVIVNKELHLRDGVDSTAPGITTDGSIKLTNIFVYTDKASFAYGGASGLNISGTLTSIDETTGKADLTNYYAVPQYASSAEGTDSGENKLERYEIVKDKSDTDESYRLVKKNAISLQLKSSGILVDTTVMAVAPKISSAWFVVGRSTEATRDSGAATGKTYVKELTRKSGNNILYGAVESISGNVILEVGRWENKLVEDSNGGSNNQSVEIMEYYPLDSFATLQEAFSEIDRLADLNAEYRITVKVTDTSMTKNKTSNYTFPSKAAKVRIVGAEGGSVQLVYTNDITVKTNTDFENLTLAPSAASGRINLGNFKVSLVDTLLAEGTNSSVKAISVIGGGTTKTSGLTLKTSVGKDKAEMTLAAVTNVGTLNLELVELIVNGNTSVGTLQMDNHTNSAVESFTGLGSISLINVVCGEDRIITTAPTLTRSKDKDGTTYISRVAPTLTISGKVTVTGIGGTLNVALRDKTTGDDIEAGDAEVEKLVSGNGAGIVLAKATNIESESISFNGGSGDGAIYKKAGTLIYKETSPMVVLEYTTQLEDNGRAIEAAVESHFETFADAVTEINNLKTKRPYTIRVLEYSLGDEGYNFTPGALTMPNRSYISHLTLSGYGKDSDSDEANNKVYFTGNITFTCDVTLDNIDFVQVKKVGAAYQEVDQIPSYTDGESFPAVLTLNTAGFTLDFAEGKGTDTDVINNVSFNAPILLNGGNKGSLRLDEGVQLEAYGNAGYFAPQDIAGKTYVQGKITGFGQMNISQEMYLAGWPSYNSRSGEVYNAAELNVTDLNISQQGSLNVGHEEYQDKVVVKNLTLTGGELTAAGSGSFTNVTLAGDEPKLAIISPIPTVAAGQSAAALKAATFNITGTLTSTAWGAVLETGLNAKAESALNITGRVVLENEGRDSDNRITVKVSVPAEILTELDNPTEPDHFYQDENLIKLGVTKITVLEGRAVKEKTISNVLLRARNGSEQYFAADIYCVGQEKMFDSDISVKDGYILKKTGEAINVYYAEQVGAALYKEADGTAEAVKQDGDSMVLLGYYPTLNDAVAAIEVEKNNTQNYTITLFKDAGSDTSAIKVNLPRAAKQVTINSYDYRNDSVAKIYFNQDIVLTSNTIFDGVGLVPSKAGNAYRGIQSKAFELTLRNITQEAEKPLGNIVGGGKTVTLEGVAAELNIGGSITGVSKLEIKNIAEVSQSGTGTSVAKNEFRVTVKGNVAATELVLKEAESSTASTIGDAATTAALDAAGTLTFTNVENTGANTIYYGRNTGTKAPNLTITGKVDNDEEKLVLVVVNTGTVATQPIAELADGQVKVSLANANKLATITKAALSSFTFKQETRTENSNAAAKAEDVNEQVVWSGNGVYLLAPNYNGDKNTVTVEWSTVKKPSGEDAGVGDTTAAGSKVSNATRCLDFAQASAYINGLLDLDKEVTYTMSLNGDITDPAVTDNTPVSGLTLPLKDRAAQIIVDGKKESATGQSDDGAVQGQGDTAIATRLTFSGNILVNGEVKFSYIELNNGKNFSVTNRKNSDVRVGKTIISGTAALELDNISYNSSGGKISDITGEKNVTELLVSGKELEIAGKLTNVKTLELEAELTTNGAAQVNIVILSEGGAWKAFGVTTIGDVQVSAKTGDEAGYIGTFHSLDRKKESTGLPQLTITGEVVKGGGVTGDVGAKLPIKVFDINTKNELGVLPTEEGKSIDSAEQAKAFKDAYNNTKLVVAKTESADKFIAYPYAECSNGVYVCNDSNINAYKDGKNYVSNGDISKMQIKLEDSNGGETYAATYAEAIQIINNTGAAEAEYTITLRDTSKAADGEGDTSDTAANKEAVIKTAVDRNGEPVEGALTLPQKGKAKSVTIKAEEAAGSQVTTGDAQPENSKKEIVLKFTGTITATTNLTFENVKLTEVVKKGSEYVDQDYITLNNSTYVVSFASGVTTRNAETKSAAIEADDFYKLPNGNGTADNSYELIFKSIAGNGRVTFHGQDVYSMGDINLSAVAIADDVALAGSGRITLGEIYGVEDKTTVTATTTDEQGSSTTKNDTLTLMGQQAITLKEIGDVAFTGEKDETKGKIDVVVNTCYTKTTWKKAVSQLTVSGELDEGNTLKINPYVYSTAADKGVLYEMISEEQLQQVLIAADERPAAWKKLLTAPKLKSGDGSSDNSVAIGYLDKQKSNKTTAEGGSSYNLVKYESGIYLTEEEYAVKVEGQAAKGENTYTGSFLSWEQAVKEIERLNHGPSRNEEGWTYTMILLRASDEYTPLKTVAMPSKAAEVIIVGEDDNADAGDKSNTGNTDDDSIGLLTTSGSIVLKCNTTFRGVHVAAVKKVGNTYYSAPITLNASNFTLNLEEMPESNRYKGVGSFNTQMIVTGTAKATLNAVPYGNDVATNSIVQDSIIQISKIGMVNLKAGTAPSNPDDQSQTDTIVSADYTIENGITGVGTLEISPGVDVNCSKKEVSVTNLNIGESSKTSGDDYSSNSETSTLQAKNITVTGTTTMASARLKAGTTAVGDGKITLTNVVFEDMHNHIEGKQDKNGNSLIQIKGEVKEQVWPEGEEAKDNVVSSWPAVTIGLTLNNSSQRYAKLVGGMNLLTAPKAASSWFRPYYNEAAKDKSAMGPEITETQVDAITGKDYQQALYGSYKSGNYIKYGKLMEKTGTDETTGKAILQDLIETRLWFGTATEDATYGSTCYSDFMTFEEAVASINTMALKKDHQVNNKTTKVAADYLLELYRDVEIGNTKGDGKYTALTLPAQVTQLNVLGNGHAVRFAGNVTLRSHTILDNVTLQPMKAVKGGAEPTTTNIAAGNFSLTLKGTAHCGYYQEGEKAGTKEFVSTLNNLTGGAKGELIITPHSGVKAVNVTGFSKISFAGDGDETGSGGIAAIQEILEVTGNLNVKTIVFEETKTAVNAQIIALKGLTANVISVEGEKAQPVIYTSAGSPIRLNGGKSSLVKAGTNENVSVYYPNGEAKKPQIDLRLIGPENQVLDGTRIIVGKYLYNKNWEVSVVEETWEENGTTRNTYLNGNDLYLGSLTGSAAVN